MVKEVVKDQNDEFIYIYVCVCHANVLPKDTCVNCLGSELASPTYECVVQGIFFALCHVDLLKSCLTPHFGATIKNKHFKSRLKRQCGF